MNYTVNKRMNAQEQLPVGNDYAVAKVLNEQILAMVAMVAMIDCADMDIPEDFNMSELNRAYVLVVDETQKLYDKNSELSSIKPEPIWKRFDILKTAKWDIDEFLEDPDNDLGQAHIARIDRLCILAAVDTPEFSERQSELIEYAKRVRSKSGAVVDEQNKKSLALKANDWQIPEYTLNYKLDGTIWINGLLKLKKANIGSTTERLMDQAFKSPNELFVPDLNSSRNLSTILSSAGFTKAIKKLFFPTATTKGIIFRPVITANQARADGIDTSELDMALKNLGAITEPLS